MVSDNVMVSIARVSLCRPCGPCAKDSQYALALHACRHSMGEKDVNATRKQAGNDVDSSNFYDHRAGGLC